MNKRNPITSDTLAAVADQFAGQPLDAERVETYRDFAEPIYQSFEGLRRLPLKDVEPATVFRPIESDKS